VHEKLLCVYAVCFRNYSATHRYHNRKNQHWGAGLSDLERGTKQGSRSKANISIGYARSTTYRWSNWKYECLYVCLSSTSVIGIANVRYVCLNWRQLSGCGVSRTANIRRLAALVSSLHTDSTQPLSQELRPIMCYHNVLEVDATKCALLTQQCNPTAELHTRYSQLTSSTPPVVPASNTKLLPTAIEPTHPNIRNFNSYSRNCRSAPQPLKN